MKREEKARAKNMFQVSDTSQYKGIFSISLYFHDTRKRKHNRTHYIVMYSTRGSIHHVEDQHQRTKKIQYIVVI